MSEPLERMTLRVDPMTLRTLGDGDRQHGLLNCNKWITLVGDNRGGRARGGEGLVGHLCTFLSIFAVNL